MEHIPRQMESKTHRLNAIELLAVDEPALCVYYAAAAQGVSVLGERAGKPTLRLVISESPAPKNAADDDEAVDEVGGLNVHPPCSWLRSPRRRRSRRASSAPQDA